VTESDSSTSDNLEVAAAVSTPPDDDSLAERAEATELDGRAAALRLAAEPGAAPAAEPTKAPAPEPAPEPKPVIWTRARHPFRHPNLGLAPVDMEAGHPQAADRLRAATILVAARALEAAVQSDPTLLTRYDEPGLRRLLRDGELLVERLAMCLASDNSRWLVEYAEWVAPIYRRRGISLLDLAALCDGLRSAAAGYLEPEDRSVAEAPLGAAIAVLRRNSRLAGDHHKRNALWKWMYRGV
jgi:hypothetical protein